MNFFNLLRLLNFRTFCSDFFVTSRPHVGKLASESFPLARQLEGRLSLYAGLCKGPIPSCGDSDCCRSRPFGARQVN